MTTFRACLTKRLVFITKSHDQHLLRKQTNTGAPPVKRNTLLLSYMNSTLSRIGKLEGTGECYLQLQFEAQWSYCCYIKLKALQFQMESVRRIVTSYLMTSGEAQMHQMSSFDVEIFIGKLNDLNHQIFIKSQQNSLEHRRRIFRSEF